VGEKKLMDTIVDNFAAIASVLAIIVGIITAITSTRSSAFNDLKVVVEALKIEVATGKATIEGLRLDFARERKLRMQYEDYIHALLLQMADAKITPLDINKYVISEEEK
jgi:hypothetical protein